MNKIDITGILKDAWNKTRANFWVIMNALLITALVFFITNLFSLYAEGRGVWLNLSAFITETLVDGFMVFALIRFFLGIYNDEASNVFGMFRDVKGFYKFIILYTALNVATVAGVILLVVPAIYLIITYSFSVYIMLDQELGIQESIAESARITKGNKWELFKFWLVLLFINIVGVAFFVVGLLLTLSISFLTIIEVYKRLSVEEEIA
ncbi:MAG: DUF975 family protein [bacterium]